MHESDERICDTWHTRGRFFVSAFNKIFSGINSTSTNHQWYTKMHARYAVAWPNENVANIFRLGSSALCGINRRNIIFVIHIKFTQQQDRTACSGRGHWSILSGMQFDI